MAESVSRQGEASLVFWLATGTGSMSLPCSLGFPTLAPQEKKLSFWPNNKSSIYQFKHVRSRCLDTGQTILAFHLPRLRLGLWKQTKKKNMAIIQPSWLNKLVNNAHLFLEDNVWAKYLLWTQFLFKMGPLFPRGRGSHTWKFWPFAELM